MVLLNSESVINQDYLQNITFVFNLHNVECNYCIENVPNDFNAPFTIEEVRNYTSKLPNDGLVNEMLKCSQIIIIMVPYLVVLLKKILDSGTFPESWC